MMNERIQKLAQEARSKVNALYESMEVEPDSNFVDWFDEHFEEKFSELIVNECVGIANKHAIAPWAGSDWGLGFSIGAERISKDIKKHFGVE